MLLMKCTYVCGFGRDGDGRSGALFGAGCKGEVDDVVVDDDRRDDDAGSKFTFAFGEETRIDKDASFDSRDAMGGDLLGEFAGDGERVSRNDLRAGRCAVGVIDVLESERTIGLDAVREIGIATRDEDEIRTAAIDLGVEAKVRAKYGERRSHGEELGGGTGNEELIGIQTEERPGFVERIHFDAEAGMAVLGAAHHLLQFGFEGCGGLGPERRDTTK
jgi:hypothetical protein